MIIVHHCGYDDTHPRGHTGLPGAVDAQLRITKGDSGAFTAVVEMMRDGPEEVEIVSRVQVVDLGQGPNGKPRTSLVVVPCEEPATGGHRKWPKGLTIFLDALREARRKHGEPFQVELGQLPETAVDLEKLRPCFYRLYPSDGETDRKKQDAKRQAFNRDLRAARINRLIGTATTETGRTLVWFAP